MSPITSQIQLTALRPQHVTYRDIWGYCYQSISFVFNMFLLSRATLFSLLGSSSLFFFFLSRSSMQHCYKFLVHTWHRLTRVRICSPLRVSCGGPLMNWLLCSTVVSQKLYLLAKKWQVPRAPLHSMNGVARKSSRQEPGDTRDWPPPSAPAAVC